MKSKFVALVILQLFFIVSCKTKEQVEADRLSGGWIITEAAYSQRGSNQVDSTITYSKSVFDFGSCKLTTSNRECFGYYSFNGVKRTAVSYGISVSENKLNISPVDQNNREGIDLTGSFQIEKVNEKLMYLYGPAGYTDEKGKFHLQALDIKLTLIR
ncbi:hypothetical protein GO730_38830 [Spirosoma sp. HMF3257]|uniref:Lipocalin-like domain-containing protein n=1 Tax=Spirosoma telluris TaxID=2183553 RepID=A0A327NCC9_9BACT|nr:hypothetical protein [Spirosoma telluris]RAI72857.1 hypothetical protein HMF3257_38755 [Spirosoma telluris]